LVYVLFFRLNFGAFGRGFGWLVIKDALFFSSMLWFSHDILQLARSRTEVSVAHVLWEANKVA